MEYNMDSFNTQFSFLAYLYDFFTDEEAEPMRADALDTSIKAMKAWKELRELVRTNSFELTREKLLKVIDDTIADIEK